MRYRFKDVVIDSRTGLNPRKNFVLGNGENNYITIKDIYNGQINITDKTDKVDDEAIQIIKKRSRIKVGDILFVSIGRIGETAIVEAKDDTWDVNESVFVFTINREIITPEYFCTLFQSDAVQKYLAGNSSGSTFKSIKMNQLERMEFDLPPLEIQESITEKLSKVKAICTKRSSELTYLDDLIKARFVEMFGDQNYMVRSLADVIVPGAGLSYGIIVPGDYYENGCPMVRPSDFKNNKLDLTNVYRVDPAIEKQYARTRLQGDEILVQVIGQPGQIIPATEECKGMNVTRNLAVVRPNNRLVNRQYLIEYLRSETAQRYLTGSSKQSTLKQLPLSLLKTLEVPIPPMELQAQFSFVVSQIDKTKSVIQKSLDETQLLFDGLMQKYFGYEDEEGHPNG